MRKSSMITSNLKGDLLSRKPETVFELDQLSVNYERASVLWDVSFSVPRGELVAIVGPNGAGKSTLIKSAMGLLSPLSGRALFFGKPLSSSAQKVAYVPQRESVDWDFPITVKELALMGRYGGLGLFKRPRAADKAQAMQAIESVGLTEFADRQINELSGGQQQRAFLARAFAQEADLYFLDEPFSGVDKATEKSLIELMEAQCKEGKTFIVVHHDLQTVPAYFSWVVLLNMCLVASGPVKKTFTSKNIAKAYGRSLDLLMEVAKMTQEKSEGLS